MSSLTDRRQVLSFQGKMSQEISVLQGVPQGTVRGSALCNILESYKPCLSQNKCLPYADVPTISMPMKTKIHSKDSISPPPDPCQIVVAFFKEWAEKNDMLINTDKMKMITLSLRTDHISHSPTFIAERQIDEVSNAKLLGITID